MFYNMKPDNHEIGFTNNYQQIIKHNKGHDLTKDVYVRMYVPVYC